MQLQQSKYTVEHRPGSKNINADCLSRNPIKEESSTEEDQECNNELPQFTFAPDEPHRMLYGDYKPPLFRKSNKKEIIKTVNVIKSRNNEEESKESSSDEQLCKRTERWSLRNGSEGDRTRLVCIDNGDEDDKRTNERTSQSERENRESERAKRKEKRQEAKRKKEKQTRMRR